MAKKASPRKLGSAKKATARKTTAKRTKVKKTNLDRLTTSGALDPDAAKALSDEAVANIEDMTAAEVAALIKVHLKISPKKKWQPDPDGSIF